jgi:hypothetical protein
MLKIHIGTHDYYISLCAELPCGGLLKRCQSVFLQLVAKDTSGWTRVEV